MIQFIFGFISGVYISQNYNIPDIKEMTDKIIEYIDKNKK